MRTSLRPCCIRLAGLAAIITVLVAAPASAQALPVPSPGAGGAVPVIDVDACLELVDPRCAGEATLCIDAEVLDDAEADCADGGLLELPDAAPSPGDETSAGTPGLDLDLEPVDIEVEGLLDTSIDVDAALGAGASGADVCAEIGLAGQSVACSRPLRDADESTGDTIDVPADVSLPDLADVAADVNVDLGDDGLDADVCLDIALLGGSASCPEPRTGKDTDHDHDGNGDDGHDDGNGGDDDGNGGDQTGDGPSPGDIPAGDEDLGGASTATLPFTGSAALALGLTGAGLAIAGRALSQFGSRARTE